MKLTKLVDDNSVIKIDFVRNEHPYFIIAPVANGEVKNALIVDREDDEIIESGDLFSGEEEYAEFIENIKKALNEDN